MPRLPVVTGAQMVSAPQHGGLAVMRRSGSHVILYGAGLARPVPVPLHGARTLSPGLTRKIIRQAGLTVEEFRRLLK